jgi:hypothetical protein
VETEASANGAGTLSGTPPDARWNVSNHHLGCFRVLPNYDLAPS